MKPITTFKELGEMEALIRGSERRVIAVFVRSVNPDLADRITAGEHWQTTDARPRGGQTP